VQVTWWDRNIGHNPHWGHPSTHPQYKWLASFIQPAQRILEVGYGTGHAYAAIRHLTTTYRGYDLTTTFQSICQSRYLAADFRIASATQLPEPTSSWDVVFARHLLEHVPDWKAALSEMVRVCAQSVAILAWRPLSPHPTRSTNTDVCAWVFNRKEFIDYAFTLTADLTVIHDKHIYVIHKEPDA
jgi:ubiquinone/menaquinone biosynthesis C-methylase UbiE